MTDLAPKLDYHQIASSIKKALQEATEGKLPRYIPLLAKVNPHNFALGIYFQEQALFSLGDTYLRFPLMSVIKPFLLLKTLWDFGQDYVFTKVGHNPSDYPFNSLRQLIEDQGFPRNPMINSGAIALAGLLPGKDAQSRCEHLCQWLNNLANCQLFLDYAMLESVHSQPNVNNQALVREMSSKGYLDNPKIALETYNYICCLSGTVLDVVHLGILLVNPLGTLNYQHCQVVQELMTKCGLYEKSLAFAGEVGLPTKSGISGIILSIIPNQGAIAVYSPPLDKNGNSVAGLYLVEKIAAELRGQI